MVPAIAYLAAALLQTLPPPAQGQWEPLGTPRDGVTNSVDAGSIARTGDRVAIRMKAQRSSPDPDGLSIAIIAYTIDCSARTATLDGIDLYRADGSFGRSIAGDDPAPVGNDPDQRALFQRACVPAAAAPPTAPPARN